MGETETISLYIELAEGQKADLEVVARASIAFAQAIKEVAFLLDPTLELRVELQSGTEDSLSLNSLLHAVAVKPEHRSALKGAAVAAALWISGQVGTDIYNQSFVHEWIQGHPDGTLTPETIRQIVDQIKAASKASQVRPHVEEIYRELDRDPAIQGVGAARDPGTRPSVVVPRSEFKARSGVGSAVDVPQPDLRETTTEETLILVSPVLLDTDNRKWRFRTGSGEIGATIDDEEFRNAALSGRVRIPLVTGVQMYVILKTVEVRTQEGLWKPADRSIVRVIGWRPPPQQGTMNFSAPRPEKDKDDSGE